MPRRRFKPAPFTPTSRLLFARTRRQRLARAAAQSSRPTASSLRRNAECAQPTTTRRLANGPRSGVTSPDQDASCIDGGKGELNFSSSRELFCSLIAPLTEKEFFSKHWERKPLLIKRGLEKSHPQASLFTLATLRQLVEEHSICHGRHVNISRYMNGRKKKYGKSGELLTSDQFDKLLTLKRATVQFLQPQQFQDELWQVLTLMESYFNSLVGCNVYITPSGSQGLAPHYDDVEVFILQLEGSKRWRLYPPSLPLPLTSSPDLPPDTIGSPSHDFVLEAGDLLYFPRGTIHQASTPLTSSHSTHITISTYQQNTWGDLLCDSLTASIHQLMATDIEYRSGIPLHMMAQNQSGDVLASLKDKLQSMGRRALEHMNTRHQDHLIRHRLSFVAARLPPYTTDLHEPQGPAPNNECMVKIKWPEHMVLVTAAQVRGVVGCVESSPAGEEVTVYHSLANDRRSHMMMTEEGPPRPHGVRLQAHHLPALSLLLSSPSPIPSTSLPLSSEDRHTLLLSLWVEGLLQIT